MKPEDITMTSKRKAESEETKENETICYPDEDNNSILNFTKLNNLVFHMHKVYLKKLS